MEIDMIIAKQTMLIEKQKFVLFVQNMVNFGKEQVII